MKSYTYILFYFLVLVSAIRCGLSPGFSDIPEIEFISISKDTINQGSLLTDSLLLVISFTDGDGDLGTERNGVFENIVLTDSRTQVRYDRYKIPPLDIAGAMTGIEGEIILKVYNTCCLFPDNIPPCSRPPQYPFDELQLEVIMIDDSGNESNRITTPKITLLCN